MTLVRLILLLGICVTGFVTIECVDCSNEAGYCDFYSYYLRCYIATNNTQSIKALLRDCSNSSTFNSLDVYKNYVSNEYGNLLIDIELPTNIQSLSISNTQDKDHIRLTTFNQNTGLTYIYAYSSYIELESNNFFTQFTALQYINLQYVLSREPPSFTNLLSLTFLRVYLVGPVTHALDEGIVSGLTNLVYLHLSNSYFNGITEGAFRNLNQLTYLDVGYNELAYIEDGALRDLSSLQRLSLYGNNIQIVSDNVFEGLTDLTLLDLNSNPEFPITALIQAKSVISLYIRNNGYHTLDSYVFQQMNSLTYLYLSDPFVCDCDLRWTSLVGQYQLNFLYGYCDNHFSRSITSIILYTNCSQTESFQCFNKSITCPDNQVCHNTEDSYFCGCPRGYALHSSGQCKDVDECDETTDCQHTCQNTEGSFHCTCDEGYELSSDGYSCDDIDECQVSNGGCEFGCRNTVGSYQCLCYYGHKLTNKTHCDNEIQYIVIQGIEDGDYQFDCYGDFNLSITNLTCENIPPTGATTTMLTTTTTTASSGCPIGYVQRYSGECVDEDECDFYTNCQHSCVNTEGSFHCDCDEGYELADDQHNCTDVNECHQMNGGCEFGCRNTIGSYQCYCYYGLELTNNTHCGDEIHYILVQGIENKDYRFACYGDYNLSITNFTCGNIPPTSTTTTMSATVMTTNVTTITTTTTIPSGCPMGYVEHYSGECVDEDECDFYTNCQHSCVNTEGSFYCDCYEGYELADNLYNCTDVNECHQQNGGCEFGCRNTIGSYQCYCYYGLELTNNTHCKDEIQCNIQQSNASQGNYFTCEGLKLTIDNLTYNNSCDQTIIQNTENPSTAMSSEQIPSSTIIMFAILILIIGVQTIIIILVLLCSLTMRKAMRNPKIHRNMRQAHFQENVSIPLEDIIEKQPNIPPSMTMQNPDNTEVTSMYEHMDGRTCLS